MIIWTREKIAVIFLRFETVWFYHRGSVSTRCRQNGKQCRVCSIRSTQQFDLGLHCLPRHICQKTSDHYRDTSLIESFQFWYWYWEGQVLLCMPGEDSKHHSRCLMTKPTKWQMCPAKTQISLGIRPVWSESSLSTWRNLGSLATH